MLMASAAPAATTANDPAMRRRGLTLALLTAAYFCSYMDRQILAIIQELIRADLHLSDTQLGLIQGFAFAIFYAGLGVPVAWLADRSSRVNIIAIALALWSAFTVACGFAGSFAQLLLARIGVGVGEAGSSPPSHSIIADLYPPESRAGAMAIYTWGIVFGAFAGTFIGGAVGHTYGWRVAMFTVGAPGIVLAVLVKLLMTEPRRGLSETAPLAADATQPGMGAAFASLWADRVARHLVIGVTLISGIGYAYGAFGPSYLQRSQHLTLTQIITVVAPVAFVISTVSGLGGGQIADRLARRYGLYAQAWMIAGLHLIGFLPFLFFFLAPTVTGAVGGYWTALLFVTSYLGPTFGMIQGRAPLKLRASWAAITLLAINLIGLGLGPIVVGILSEHFRPRFGEESLRYALLCVVALGPWPAVHYWRAGVLMRRERDSGTTTNPVLFRPS